jgi:hypothetical protein
MVPIIGTHCDEVQMRNLISIGVLVCALTGVATAQSDAALQEQLLATLHRMYAAEKTHDLAVIRSCLSDDFAEAAGDGRIYRGKRSKPAPPTCSCATISCRIA